MLIYLSAAKTRVEHKALFLKAVEICGQTLESNCGDWKIPCDVDWCVVLKTGQVKREQNTCSFQTEINHFPVNTL